MNVKKRMVLIITLLCLMCLCLFVGCKTKNVYFSVPELSYENAIHAEKGKNYRLEVPENPGYFFAGYYDENGKQFTDGSGQSIDPFDGKKLELVGKYTPRHYQFIIKKESGIEYSGVDSYRSSFRLQNGYYRSESSWYAIGLTLPELPTVTQAHKIFKGWYTVKGEEKIQIADENGYLKGMDKLNAEAFDLAANPTVEHATLELFPLFDPIIVNVTFTYNQNGREITETLQVPEGEYLDEVAPKYTDGETEHVRCWYKKGYDYSEDKQAFQNHYKGTTEEGLELYAPDGFFIRNHFNTYYEKRYKELTDDKTYFNVQYESGPYFYEYYTVDRDGKETAYIDLTIENHIQYSYRAQNGTVNTSWSTNKFSSFQIQSNTKEVYFFDFLGGTIFETDCPNLNGDKSLLIHSPIVLEGIQISERSDDLTIKFRTNSNHIHAVGDLPLIDASAMKDGSVLTLDFLDKQKYVNKSDYFLCVHELNTLSERIFDGADGMDRSIYTAYDGDGANGGDGKNGKSVQPLIMANNLVLRSESTTTTHLCGGNGGNGGNGGGGEVGNGPKNSTAGAGGAGGWGGSGGCALRVGGNLKIEGTSSWVISGGNGGTGGNGGRGGDGQGGFTYPDYGGDGGKGGGGGNGARAIEFGEDANTVIGVTKMQGALTVTNGNGGDGGKGGDGGNTKTGLGQSVLGGYSGGGGNGGNCYDPKYVFDSDEAAVTISSNYPGAGKKKGTPGKGPYGYRENHDFIWDGENGHWL